MKPRIALVGCGRWGRNIARCLHELGLLAGVCDLDTPKAQAFGELFRVPVLSLDTLCADVEVGAVAIASPAVTHAAVGRRMLEAGKHLFVEKPMAMTVAEARGLAAQARDAGRVLMVGHLLQYHAAFLRLRERVAAGDIGALRYVYSNRLSFGQIRTEENSLWSFAPHDISMILSLMGTMPESVSATGAAYVQAHLPDVTTTHLQFEGGRRAHVFVSWLHPYKEQRLVAVGDRGMIEFNDGLDWPQKVTLYAHRVGWRGELPTVEKAPAVAVPVEPAEPLLEEMRHFCECIEHGRTPRTPASEGIAVLEVLNAAQAGLDSGQLQRLRSP